MHVIFLNVRGTYLISESLSLQNNYNCKGYEHHLTIISSNLNQRWSIKIKHKEMDYSKAAVIVVLFNSCIVASIVRDTTKYDFFYKPFAFFPISSKSPGLGSEGSVTSDLVIFSGTLGGTVNENTA